MNIIISYTILCTRRSARTSSSYIYTYTYRCKNRKSYLRPGLHNVNIIRVCIIYKRIMFKTGPPLGYE